MAEAARVLALPVGLLTRLCDEGRVPCHPVGGSWRIAVADVAMFQCERDRIKSVARVAVATADDRRRVRAAEAARDSLA